MWLETAKKKLKSCQREIEFTHLIMPKFLLALTLFCSHYCNTIALGLETLQNALGLGLGQPRSRSAREAALAAPNVCFFHVRP